jgi:hypothetical protein
VGTLLWGADVHVDVDVGVDSATIIWSGGDSQGARHLTHDIIIMIVLYGSLRSTRMKGSVRGSALMMILLLSKQRKRSAHKDVVIESMRDEIICEKHVLFNQTIRVANLIGQTHRRGFAVSVEMKGKFRCIQSDGSVLKSYCSPSLGDCIHQADIRGDFAVYPVATVARILHRARSHQLRPCRQ